MSNKMVVGNMSEMFSKTAKKMRILILADNPHGWIIDRLTDEMIKRLTPMGIEFTKGYFGRITAEELLAARHLPSRYDLIHYQNVIEPSHIEAVQSTNCSSGLCRPCLHVPILMSVRSHRYPKQYIDQYLPFIDQIHVVNKQLITEFEDHHKRLNLEKPPVKCIYDGIFDQFMTPKQFTVGFAGHPDQYKGFELIKEACARAGVNFKPAHTLPPHEMLDYYRSIDLYVCASEAEGHSTPVMECLALNKPVITTNVGVPQSLNVHTVERTVESIQKGIERFYTWPQVSHITWQLVCQHFYKLYQRTVDGIQR